MASTSGQTPSINISAKSAGAFLAALVVGLGSYFATGDNGKKHCPTCPTRAEFNALATTVKQLAETNRELEGLVKKHNEYSEGKVLEIEKRFSHLETWEVEHEKRENFQDQMLSDCIRSLRNMQ